MATDTAVFDGVGNTSGTVVPTPPSGAGTKRAATFDNVGAGVPSQVAGISVIGISDTSITIAWPPALGADSYVATNSYLAYDAFRDGFIDSFSGLIRTVTTGFNTLRITWGSLSPSTTYVFTVHAVNAAGPGLSATLQVSTLATPDPTSGGTLPPPPPVTPPVSVQPTGQAFPAGRAFRPANEGLTYTEATA